MPMNAPAPRPSIMPRPDSESALGAEKQERRGRREEPADVAPKGQHRAETHQEPAAGALGELGPRGHADRELAREERGDGAADDHAEVEERARVEPGRQEIGAADETDAGQHPIAPVPEAVRGGPRTIEGEEEDVQGGDEHRGAPYEPRVPEHRCVKRSERARFHARGEAPDSDEERTTG